MRKETWETSVELNFLIRVQFTLDEMILIEKARKAVAGISRSFTVKRTNETHLAEATVWDAPLRLDFRVHVPGEIGQAFIGPQVLLTEDLFDGNNLKPEIVKQFEEGFDDFAQHMQQGI